MSVIAWTDVLARYNELSTLPNVTSTGVQATLISYAEASVHGKLGSRFAVPFSSNNITAKDLMVDALYVQNQLTRQPEKAKTLAENLDARIKLLLTGQADMIDSNGALAATMVGDTIWSSTQDYPPTFGVGDVEKAIVSSGQLYAEAVLRGEVV